MASATEPQAEAPSVPTASETGKAAQPTATSPARSDKSSDSEGKPVREKLKETRIDAQGVATSENGVNGSAKSGEQSASGSDSERGRLRRKRSREDFEDEAEADKHAGKKIEVAPERHVRKRSRDISKDDLPPKPAPSRISSINENDVDEQMTSPNKAKTSSTTLAADTSPKNKRTRDQAESDAATEGDAVQEPSTNGKPVEGRDTKRPRDQQDDKDFMSIKPQSKVAPSSGFANTSAASPFAAMAAKPKQESKTSDNTPLPQTSEDKFKASGFGSFSSSASSPFGGLGSSKSAAASPFGAASGNKLSSFAGSTTSSKSPPSGFAGLGGFSSGSMAGKGFGSLGGLGSKTGLTNFGTPGNTEIKGLKVKNHQPFGAAGEDSPSGSEDDDDSDPEGNGEEKVEGKPSKTLIASPPRETGEEGESTIWQGRAKLYTMAGDDGNRAWKERGTGNFKFNITNDDPRKARFVLRADGTHRLLLNAAVTKTMTFGGNAQGEKPKDTRLLFNAPTPEGELEMYLLKLKAENAIKLWEEVTQTQEKEL